MSEKDLKGKYSGSITGDVTLTNSTPSANGELGYDPAQGFLGYHNGAVGPIGGGNTSWETSDAGNNQITFNAGSRIVNSVVTTIASDITTNSTPVAITNDTLTTLDSSNGMLYAASASVRVFIFYDIINEEFVGIGNSTETSDYTWDYRNNNSNFNINLSQYVPTGYVDVSASGNPGTLTFTITNWPVQAWTTFASVAAAEEWQDWTPTFSASGSMTFTVSTLRYARYRRVGNSVEFALSVIGTTGGTANQDIFATLPIPPKSKTSDSIEAVFYSSVGDPSPTELGNCFYSDSQNALYFRKADNTNWTIGANRLVRAQGSYEISEADGFNPISVGFPNLSDLVQVKTLSTDVTTDQTMTDLTTTLEVGKTYEVYMNVAFTASTDASITVEANHDGSVIGIVQCGSQNDTDYFRMTKYIAPFVATTNNITFSSASVSAGGAIRGNNDTLFTHVVVREVPQAGTAVLIPKTVYYARQSGSVTGLSNAAWTDVGLPLYLPAGRYEITIGGITRCVFSSVPNYGNGSFLLSDVPSTYSAVLVGGTAVGIARSTVSVLDNTVTYSREVDWAGGNVYLYGYLNINGGTVTDRNISLSFIKATKLD